MEIANSTPLQRELLTKLQSENRNLRFAWDAARGALSFVRSDNLAKVQRRESGDSERSRSDSLSAFLEKNGALFGLSGNSRTLRLLRTGKDDLGFFHHEYQQFAETNDGNGGPASIEVHGARLGAHFAPDGELVIVLSSCYPDILPANSVKTTAAALRAGVRESLEPLDGFHELEARMTEREKLFPLTHEPRLVIHPWRGKPIYCWATYGYGPVPNKETGNGAGAIGLIVFGQMFFNAETGALFLFAPMQSGAENPVVGNGLSSIPVGGPFTSRPLQVVRIDAGPTHRLKDTTRARAIVTYDADADNFFADPTFFIVAGLIPVSENMGASWNGVAANTTDADRTASQQPEVDGHATCGEVYDWYFAIGGRVGWDNNRYPPTVPPQTINFVAHAFDASLNTSRSANSRFDLASIGGQFFGCIVCFDGDPTAATQNGVACDYVAGSRVLVAHEYQHGVTHFSVDNVAGNPGGVPIQSETSPAGTPLAGWGGAVHEGLSDVFAGLFSGDWWMGGEISSTGRLWRNLAFPRDPTPLSAGKADHWDDRDIDAAGPNPDAGYFRGCILAHAAYLMAQGGVHQRSSRTPALIPVRGLGREVAGGQSVYKAARFWYRTLAYYLPIIGPFSGTSTLDEEKFRRIRNDCVNAAVDLYGLGSAEYKTAVLAWYAVGLQPAGTSYGADVTFLTWGADWWRSRPYVGVPSPDWSAPDLFINNGGISEWNALINVVNGGAATQFQNDVFARVRNIGDQQADDVLVHFEYTKITSSGAAAAWQPMVDKNGNVQALNIGILGAGQSNFPDSAQNAPPAAAGVKWWIPPLLAGEVLHHFCIRARVVSSNDVNEFNNEVQSNVAFSNYVPGAHLRFLVSNGRSEPMKVELALSHTLPYDWKVGFVEPTDKLVLKPWETRSLEVEVDIPDSLPTHLTAPLNGRIIGSLEGDLSAKFTGTLHRSRLEGKRLVAEVGLNLNDGDHVSGRFDGRFDAGTAAFDGEVTGTIQRKKPSGSSAVKLLAKGWLRPDRMINIAQVEEGIAVGGVSFQIQVPLPKETPFGKLPPTGTKIEPGKTAEGHGSGAAKLG